MLDSGKKTAVRIDVDIDTASQGWLLFVQDSYAENVLNSLPEDGIEDDGSRRNC